MAKICRGYNFGSRKPLLAIKRDFGIIKPDFRGLISERNESFPCEKTHFMTSYLQTIGLGGGLEGVGPLAAEIR